MKTQNYGLFWKKIHHAAKDKGFPVRVMFELTYRCNFNCPHCYVPHPYRKRSELKTKEIFLILDQLADIGCFYLGFTGGEPFMRRDIMQILKYAKKKGFEIIIYSNGSLINKKIAAELGKIGLNKIDITIPGMSRRVFESVTKLPGSRDKVFRAIGLLRQNNVPLGFKTCVLKGNSAEIKEIEGFARSLGALHRLDNMLSARLDGSKEPYKFRGILSVVRSSELIVHSQDRKNDTLEDDCKVGQEGELFKCGVGKSQATVTPQGELKMCLMIDLPRYKIIGSSLEDAWRKLRRFVAGIKIDKNYLCDKCSLKAYCKWCPARGWLEAGSFTACDPQSRQWAKRIKEEAKDGAQIKI